MGLDRVLLAKQGRENFLTLSSQLTVENRVLQRMLTTELSTCCYC